MTLSAHKKPPTDKVTIRMYRMGFGDCFLLSIPHDGGLRKVLIDCGTIKRDPNLKKGAGHVAKQVIKDIGDADGTARIDILIATHRHKDHVTGFADLPGMMYRLARSGCPGPSPIPTRKHRTCVLCRTASRRI